MKVWIDLGHFVLVLTALGLLWTGLSGMYAPAAPTVIGGLLLAFVAMARSRK